MSFILRTRDGEEREFWCPSNGGYVRLIDEDHPGTLGAQVCEELRSVGNTLWCDSPEKLPALIRRERRRELRAIRKYEEPCCFDETAHIRAALAR